ncbi:RepB family plasmid replication initiator protein [Methylotuvimicrobium alcaliphilum]|uniref:Initiator RepB protein n=1 Tax=Methylotuvimicrobium alcaliphilum (strain DSM 19304 / NCIMB 14124 / VKM B-2133 / 20Z) TaxID=1091494 RepID=G4T4H4_META2|nr:RepB family plasmid replication initiator protein [Methylotuvimicrobium alcaliphilum]CCE25730.1 Initiator RepB protein [Methylotuvimicrobium alcaliphilum 20Z]
MDQPTYLTVVKSNKVVEASYMLTLAEQRVLLACITQVDSTAELSENFRFEVTASGVADLVGLDSLSNAYRDLKKAAEKLYERSVIIDHPDPGNPQITQRKTRWISSIDYVPGEGKLVLSFSVGIIPYLSQLSKEFTKLKHVARFESVYSIRLYELLVQWSSAGEQEIEVEWLKTQFQVEDKYSRLTDLKKRVVDPAIAEINEHSNLWVEYGQRKSGRTVTHFQFKFGLKNQPKPRQQLTDADIEREARPGETRVAVIARLNGNSVAKDAKPGETFDQALQRKKELADVKRKLR